MAIQFDTSYAQLPSSLFEPAIAAGFPAPSLLRLNEKLAGALGLDVEHLSRPESLAMFAGKSPSTESQPIAMAYAGHQFGNWVPSLGDGRAMLMGEITAPNGDLFDLHLKGSGRTAFSRGGDGKAVLGAVLREYIVSEAMAGLNIASTRALAIIATGEAVQRELPEPGAVLARVAASHIRVGTFQYLYARRDNEGLKSLLEHVIARHYPDAATAENPALAVLEAAMERQAGLVAKWLSVGFIHGVMNTDNVAISGETIDYGPCAFLDEYDPTKVFSSIDQRGRYAYANQPGILHWNLAQFGQSLLPLIDADAEKATTLAQCVLDKFGDLFNTAYMARFGAKFGLLTTISDDAGLMTEFLDLMARESVDFTLAFRHLTQSVGDRPSAKLAALFADQDSLLKWHDKWQNRLGSGDLAAATEAMQAANPIYIARNHRVEQAIEAANSGDFHPFEDLLLVLENPFAEQADFADFETPPDPDEVVQATFCGT